MTSKSLRRQSANKVASDEPSNRHIRFDYSDTYLNNEDLDNALEDQEYQLRRQQYRKTMDSEKDYKKAKQDADEMLQLKNALKDRDPNESSKRVTKSAKLSRRGSSRQLHIGTIDNKPETKTDVKEIRHVQCVSDSDKTDTPDGPNEEMFKPKMQINNLTMFLLSLQKLKGCGLRQKTRETRDPHEEKSDVKDEQQLQLLRQNEARLVKNRPSSLKSVIVHGGNPDKKQERSSAQRRPSSEYGIHVKKDFSRSRRELEEISRIEQNAKYGYVNKYEERRKRLLDTCRNTDTLNEKINVFLKDVDDFKKVTSNVNSLERVLLRSKSAQISRPQPLFW